MATIPGSLTPSGSLNPSLDLLYFDEQTLLPTNIEVHYTDLNLANTNGATDWKVLFDYRSFYKLKDISPTSMLDLAERMYLYSDLAGRYLYLKARKMPPS